MRDGDAYAWVADPEHECAPLPADRKWGTHHDWRSTCWYNLMINHVGQGDAIANDWIAVNGHPSVEGPDGFVLPRGFRLPINLYAAPGLGDWMPPAEYLAESSVALVSTYDRRKSLEWNGVRRPVLDGVVDLVTGSPLLQFMDLDLPFGASSFRLIRTASQAHRFDDAIVAPGMWGGGTQHGSHGGGRLAAPVMNDGDFGIPMADRWWGWAGLGWMVSESPLLLIDSALPDLVGPHARTSWLVLDAHHAIPFQLVSLAQGSGQQSRVGYEAPPRFRAKMTHNGIWGTRKLGKRVVSGWSVPPTQYQVSLYDGAVTYTFVAVYDDVPPKLYDEEYIDDPTGGSEKVWIESSYHDSAFYTTDQLENSGDLTLHHHFSPGLGIPHYGLCVEIRDRFGHTVDIHYCDVDRASVDDTGIAPPYGDPLTEEVRIPTDDCVECRQDCRRKGQISHIRLRAEGQTVWTLVYAHREFIGQTEWGTFSVGNVEVEGPRQWATLEAFHSGTTVERSGAVYGLNAIDSIYVFRGGLSPLEAQGSQAREMCISIPVTDQPYQGEPAVGDALAWYNDNLPTGHSALPESWRYKIQYHYQPTNWNALNDPPGSDRQLLNVPVLMRSELITRAADSAEQGVSGTEQSRSHYLRNRTDWAGAYVEGGANLDRRVDGVWVDRIYTQEDLNRLRGWVAAERAMLIAGNTSPQSALHVLSEWHRISDDAFMVAHVTTSESSPEDQVFSEHHFQNGSASQINLGGTNYNQSVDEYPHLTDAVNGFASFWIAPSARTRSWHPQGTATAPAAPVMVSALPGSARAYVGSVASNRLSADPSHRAVREASIRTADGSIAYYRVHRFVVLPEEVSLMHDDDYGATPPFHVEWSSAGTAEWTPNRSILVHPYRWRSYDAQGSTATNLAEPRWIAVIDAFGTRQDMMNVHETYAGAFGVKRGQIGRRIVQMNPAGYVLSDRLWQFDRDGSVSGASVLAGGIGEEYVYRTVQDLLEEIAPQVLSSLETEFTNLPGYPESDIDPEGVYESFLTQLLLDRVRSVGWAAADVSSMHDGATQGVVQFIEYGVFPGEGLPGTAGHIPLSERVQVTAQGIQQGDPKAYDTQSAHPARYYTKQWFRDPEAPSDITAEVEFLHHSGAQALLSEIPSYIQAAESDLRLTVWRRERAVPTLEPGDPEPPVSHLPVTRAMVIGPGRVLRPGQPVWYFPVEISVFDEDLGSLMWSASGLVRDPEDPANPSHIADPNQMLVLTYIAYDSGTARPALTLVDTEGGVTRTSPWTESPVQVPMPPTGLARLPQSGPSATEPLNYATWYRYDSYGMSDMCLPNGRYWARRYAWISHAPEQDPPADPDNYPAEPDAMQVGLWQALGSDAPAFVREFVFSDIERNESTYRVLSSGEVREYSGSYPAGRPLRTRRVEYVAIGAEEQDTDPDIAIFLYGGDIGGNVYVSPGAQSQQPWFRTLAERRRSPDLYGRLSQAELFDRDVDGVLAPVGFKHINDLGEVYREREMDGTITRIVRNALGQNLRRYSGTVDDGWLTPHDPNNFDHVPLVTSGESRNNLVLVERTEYGATPNDIWLPTIARRYTTNTGFSGNWHEYPYGQGPSPGDDAFGQATRTSYDWRMRPVRVDVFAQGDPESTSSPAVRLTTTLTFLDHADRAVLEVMYGPDTSSASLGVLDAARDPSRFSHDSVLPDPGDFLAGSGLKPLSVVRTVYGVDGNVTERYDYDVTSNGANFHSTFSYTGIGGNVVYAHSPGDGVQITVLDGLGRSVRTITVIPNSGAESTWLQLARTDYEHDADNNVIRTTHWERVVPDDPSNPSAPVLGASNAVHSTTLNWYDVKRRLVASADIGANTGAADGNGNAVLVSGLVSDGVHTPHVPAWYYIGSTTNPHLPSIDASSLSIDRAGVPEGIPLSIYAYDRNGNQEYVYTATDPAATTPVVTRFTYSGLKKVLRKIENAFGDEGDQRETLYQYRFGRLAAVRQLSAYVDSSGDTPPSALAASTPLFSISFGAFASQDWGAEVVDVGADGSSGEAVSRHGSHVRSMDLPARHAQAQPLDGHDLFLRYDFQGRLAERLDARGLAMRYRYDELDRLKTVQVGHYNTSGGFIAGYPNALNYPGAGGAPADRVGHLAYTYHPDLKTYEVHARTKGDGLLIAHNKLEFDARGRLINDWQSLGVEIGSGSPRTRYTWETAWGSTEGAVGHDRLASIMYPLSPGGAARHVLFDYGASGSASSVTSRIESIRTRLGGGGTIKPLAAFEYVGVGRRARMVLGDDLFTQDLGFDTSFGGDDLIGLHGVDAFGRVQTLEFRKGVSGASLTKFEYTYDLVGNRLTATRTPKPAVGAGSATQQDQENTYDVFQRLVMSAFADDDGSTVTTVRADEWSLDAWGTWSELTTLTPTGPPGGLVTSHVPDGRTGIGVIEVDDGTTPTLFEPTYDAAGNLIFDGAYCYQYDAWNRLIQINKAHATGSISPIGTAFSADELVKHFTYDGLGRLARTISPFPDPESEANSVRSERFFYDGIRRIQEVLTDPLLNLEEAESYGELGALEAFAENPELDPQGLTGGSEQGQLLGELEPDPNDPPPPVAYLSREYVWGPGDGPGSGAGVYELLVIFDEDRDPWWIGRGSVPHLGPFYMPNTLTKGATDDAPSIEAPIILP
ncbi:MAG: RHS repeat protein [Phycisphaeraceae bacterium]|nr:RHS repeat protein [Phycisphaeraceae bacterium]